MNKSMSWRASHSLPVLSLLLAASLYPRGALAGDGYTYNGRPVSKRFYQASLIGKDAELLIRNNRLEEAVDRLQQALALAPDYVEAEVNLGNVQLRLGNSSEAIRHLKHAVEAGSTIEEGWINLAGAQVTAKQPLEATVTYEKFLQKFPSSKYADRVKEILWVLKNKEKVGSSTNSGANEKDYYAEAVGTKYVRWPSDMMPLRVYLRSGEGKNGYSPSFAGIVKDSFNVWQQSMDQAVTFQYVTDPAKAKITVEWVDDPGIVKRTGKSGETQLTRTGDTISNAVIHLLIGARTVSDNDMRQTSLHEIGHALGVQGHSPNPDDIMFFSTTMYRRSQALSARDIATMKRIYSSDYFAVSEVSRDHESGVAALERKDYKTAVELFAKVIKARPDLESARVNLGLCYAGLALELDQAKSYAAAEEAYRAALKVRKTLSRPQVLNSAALNFASMLRDRGREKEALEVDNLVKLHK